MNLDGKSLKGNFIRYIIPSILAQWVYSLYSMVDGMFVAKGVNEIALTAVNLLPVCCVSLCALPSVCSGGFHHCLDTAGGEPPSAGLRGIYTEYCFAGNLFAGNCASGHVEP